MPVLKNKITAVPYYMHCCWVSFIYQYIGMYIDTNIKIIITLRSLPNTAVSNNFHYILWKKLCIIIGNH